MEEYKWTKKTFVEYDAGYPYTISAMSGRAEKHLFGLD